MRALLCPLLWRLDTKILLCFSMPMSTTQRANLGYDYSLSTFVLSYNILLTSNIFLTITHISCTTVSVCVCVNAHPQGSPRSKTPPVARISSSDWYDIFPCSLHPFRHPLWTTCSIIWLRWMRQVMFSNRCNIKESSIFKSAVHCWYYKLHHLFSSLLTVMFPRYKNKSYADWQ